MKIVSAAVIVGATVTGAGILAHGHAPAAAPPAGQQRAPASSNEVITMVARPGKLVVKVIERGSLEAKRTADVYCKVEGRVAIVEIKPEGAKVKKGDIVCRLDPDGPKKRLAEQTAIEEAANESYKNATLARELAEISYTEYVEGKLVQEQSALKGLLAEARSAITKANARRERTELAIKRLSANAARREGAATSADIVAELDLQDRLDDCDHTILHHNRALELTKTKLNVLEKLTGPKTTKELQAVVDQKRSLEQTKKLSWQREHNNTNELGPQVDACVIRAPFDGVIVYANDSHRMPGRPPAIEEGAVVRERQKILSVFDYSGGLEVNVKVPEEQIEKMKRGLKARIRVDAFAYESFDGTVTAVAALPDSSRSFESKESKKVYSVWVNIDKGLPALRPGMTADVEILVNERDDVLSVPVQAVVHFSSKDHVAIRNAVGRVEWREVQKGASNLKFVEIVHGLNSGETVVLNAQSLKHPE